LALLSLQKRKGYCLPAYKCMGFVQAITCNNVLSRIALVCKSRYYVVLFFTYHASEDGSS